MSSVYEKLETKHQSSIWEIVVSTDRPVNSLKNSQMDVCTSVIISPHNASCKKMSKKIIT